MFFFVRHFTPVSAREPPYASSPLSRFGIYPEGILRCRDGERPVRTANGCPGGRILTDVSCRLPFLCANIAHCTETVFVARHKNPKKILVAQSWTTGRGMGFCCRCIRASNVHQGARSQRSRRQIYGETTSSLCREKQESNRSTGQESNLQTLMEHTHG